MVLGVISLIGRRWVWPAAWSSDVWHVSVIGLAARNCQSGTWPQCCLFRLLLIIVAWLNLQWIRELNQGIPVNDTTDSLAKQTSLENYKEHLSTTCYVTYNDAVRIAADIAKKSWQQNWDQDVSRYYTRQLIPEVGTKVCFPEKRNIGISYCHLLLHDTMLRDDTFRTGTSDTPVCECGLERETAAHFLLYCNRFQEARNLLLDTVNEVTDFRDGRNGYVCLKLCYWHRWVTMLQARKISL